MRAKSYHRLIGLSAFWLIAGESVLVAQNNTPIPCYDPATYPGTQSGPCSGYCDCPGNTLCAAPSGRSIGGVVATVSVACTDMVGGISVGGRCTGGTPSGLPAACGPVIVASQACPPDCSTGGGEE